MGVAAARRPHAAGGLPLTGVSVTAMLPELSRLSLRVRVFLFFALLAAGSLLALAVGLYFGYRRLADPQAWDEMLVVGIVAGCAILGLIAWVWLLFDEHVAQAIDRLAGNLRARTHTDIRTDLDPQAARYLGDLAPAAATVTRYLNNTRSALAETVSRETARLASEKARLETLLSDVPVGVILCSPDHQLVFYNGHAAALLGMRGPLASPGLSRPLADFLDDTSLRQAYERLAAHPEPDAATDICLPLGHGGDVSVRMRLLTEAFDGRQGVRPGYVLTLNSPLLADALPTVCGPRTAVYDFDLLSKSRNTAIYDTELDDLVYVVFDTETTGLLPNKGDEIVQIAAVRIVNGKRLDNEVFDTLVNPGRAIPAVSTQIHGITETMVAKAPDIIDAGRRFHAFARDAVLVAHNAPFDMAFLQRDEARLERRFDHPVLDTVLLSAILFGQAESHSLDALAYRFDVHIPNSARHTALGDTLATADIFLKMVPALKARGLTTFGAVLDEMRRYGRLLRDVNR